jgi:glycosyltransferase involved in cell wall biosynthesis
MAGKQTRINNTPIVWITWERQPRNRSMSAGLGIPLFEVLTQRKSLARFAHCIFETMRIIRTHRPRVIVCQNPSIVLTVLLLVLRPVFGFRLAIDAHFGGVDAGNGSKAPQSLLDWCNRSADLVIVTNPAHAQHIQRVGGSAFVCPDPLPDLSRYESEQLQTSPKQIFLVCSYDRDEPFREVFDAVKALQDEGFRLLVSGNYRKAGLSPEDFPHVELLGFVSEADYYRHMLRSEIVIDLTENDNCLVCGAYEALAANKPLVLSDTTALRSYFQGGVVFTQNKAGEIAAALRIAYEQRNRLSSEARAWATESRRITATLLDALRNRLGDMTQDPPKQPNRELPHRKDSLAP